MLVDLLIIIFCLSSLYRGYEIGFVRQLFSTTGFVGGLFLGAWLQHYTIRLAHTDATKSLVTALTTLGCAVVLLVLGEYLGLLIKTKQKHKKFHTFDGWLGSGLGLVSLLLSIWLLASIVSGLPITGVQSQLQSSRIIRGLNELLPGAPKVIAELGKLIDPNGFPQVFIGNEPTPQANINLPSLGDLQTAVKADEASVVKIQGQGCGGIVEGSGFVVGKNLVATNAHVVAGIKNPYVQDHNGNRKATVVWFDPNLDFAVLEVSNLAGKPLKLSSDQQAEGAPGAVLGYPGGGPLTAKPAAILARINAEGRNIYNQGEIQREVYELRANIIPGNSGGPLIAKDGSVIGVVFAESTTFKKVGYSLTMPQVISEINKVNANSSPVNTGSCVE